MSSQPMIQLEVIESKEINLSETIEITVRGYAKSKRNTRDGLVIFGAWDGVVQKPNELIHVKCVDYMVPSQE